MSTAVDDGIIRRNPCRIKGAAADGSAERPVLSARQVIDLAEVIDSRYRPLVLLAVFGSLRSGELAALRRADIDLAARTVRIYRTLTDVRGQGVTFGPPKSAAGNRIVVLPSFIVPDLTLHLDKFTAPGQGALVFTGPTGLPLRNGNFRLRVWAAALTAAGLPDIHFHDLRHTGNDLTGEAGASLRDLMERMGHSSTRAALIYQHSSVERQRALADAVGALMTAKLSGGDPQASQSGTEVAGSGKD
jgi:integrase